MTVVVEQRQLRNVQDSQVSRADIANLLADLSAQIERIRRVFEGPARAQTSDVVFVDDLAHCMECSWSRLEAAGVRATPDVIAQCSRLLQASADILQEIERLQADNNSPSASV